MKIFRDNEEKTGYVLIAPAVLLIVLLIGYPLGYSVFLSFTNSIVGKIGTFAGFANFANLLKSPVFLRVLINSVIFTIGSIIPKVVIGTSIALLIKSSLGRWSRFLKGAIMLPWVVPTSLSALAWWWMFNPLFSVLNWVIKKIFLSSKGIPWLSDTVWAMFSVILVDVWRGVPFFAISILAGLVSIDEEIYEAADTDGANGMQKFFRITLPLLKPVMAVVLLFSTVMTISEFNIIYLITGGGPRYSTHLLATFAFQEGLSTGNLSRGVAISLFVFPILFIASYFQIRIVRKDVRK